jgi:hypothetical protein
VLRFRCVVGRAGWLQANPQKCWLSGAAGVLALSRKERRRNERAWTMGKIEARYAIAVPLKRVGLRVNRCVRRLAKKCTLPERWVFPPHSTLSNTCTGDCTSSQDALRPPFARPGLCTFTTVLPNLINFSLVTTESDLHASWQHQRHHGRAFAEVDIKLQHHSLCNLGCATTSFQHGAP